MRSNQDLPKPASASNTILGCSVAAAALTGGLPYGAAWSSAGLGPCGVGRGFRGRCSEGCSGASHPVRLSPRNGGRPRWRPRAPTRCRSRFEPHGGGPVATALGPDRMPERTPVRYRPWGFWSIRSRSLYGRRAEPGFGGEPMDAPTTFVEHPGQLLEQILARLDRFGIGLGHRRMTSLLVQVRRSNSFAYSTT
jgi:hypothetical protein